MQRLHRQASRRIARLAALLATAALLAGAAVAAAAAGDPDPSFGEGGFTTASFDFQDPDLSAMAVDGEGRIVLGFDDLFADDISDDFTLVRILPDGELDSGFGGDGIVITDLGGNEGVRSLTIDREDRIIAAGYTYSLNPAASLPLVRYLLDGTLDPSFGNGGIATGTVERSNPFITGFGAVDIDREDRILATGIGGGRKGVVRFDADGHVDGAFRQVDLDRAVGKRGGLSALLAGPGGSVTVAGDDGHNALVIRLRPNGTRDGRFGERGVRSYLGKPRSHVEDLALGERGRVIAVGSRDRLDGSGNGVDEFFVLRLRRHGEPDRSFARRGLVSLAFRCETGQGGCFANATSVDVDSRGRVIAGGVATGANADNRRLALVRLTRNGQLDPSFRRAGMFLRNIGDLQNGLTDLDPLDRTVAAVDFQHDPSANVTLGRFLP